MTDCTSTFFIAALIGLIVGFQAGKRSSQTSEYAACRHCNEPVRVGATACKHCHRSLKG